MQTLRCWLSQGVARFTCLSGALLLGAAAAVMMPDSRALAANRIYFTYGPLGRSIAVDDLKNFAETGKTTSDLRWYLRVAHADADAVRRVLSQPVGISFGFVNRVFYTIPGEYVLFELGQIIHTKSRKDAVQIKALRSSLVLSTSDDNKISLIEFLEKYPTPEVYVDGVILARVAGNVSKFVQRIEPTLEVIQSFLEDLICNCDSNQTPTNSGGSQ
jgi:hypothetical protein